MVSTDSRVLTYLHSHAPTTAAVLAARLGRSKLSVYRAVQRLVKSGELLVQHKKRDVPGKRGPKIRSYAIRHA